MKKKDLALISYPRERGSGCRLGCSGLEPKEYGKGERIFEISEVDLLEYSAWSASERHRLHQQIQARHQVIGSCSSAWLVHGDETEKRILLEEVCSELQISQLIIRVQKRHLLMAWPYYPFIELFLDYPKTERDEICLDPRRKDLGRVWDPFWDLQVPSVWGATLMAKIHGWHDARWVRRYSAAQIQECMAKVHDEVQIRGKKVELLLAHSQRREQLEEFQQFN